MVTMVGLDTDYKEVVNDLINLDYDAIEAYEEAIDRLENEDFKVKMREFMMDHMRHTQELKALARELNYDIGDKIEQGPDAKQYLTKGKVVMADLFGDKTILMAMKTNEDDTNTAYERALQHENMPQVAQPVIQRALGDERRHRSWIEATIEQLND